jgi:hypothetical protein
VSQSGEPVEAGRKRSKWPERLFMLLAVVLIVAGAAFYGLQGLKRAFLGDGITHKIMPELEPVERIEADAGVLAGFNVVIITADTTRADHVGRDTQAKGLLHRHGDLGICARFALRTRPGVRLLS